ncbi:DDE superfamily endonuclease containing protein [Histomonas meleagridis]|nr:DDE superfamily endonuclease containing protein [Histomonas meleagridis]
MNAYLSKFPNDIENDEAKQFTFSHQFIAVFKNRNHLSSRSLHAKRRPTATEDDMNQFINEIKNLMDSTDHSHIVKCDETAWKIFPNGMVTWAEKGSDSISINLEASPKTSMTVLASIRADGSKIPLFFIAKGKTNRCKESQIGDVSYHMSTYTENGWTTEETFSRYLRFLRTHFNDEEEIHLLLDSYKVHRCQQIQILAASLKITLHFIPPGLTDQLQPLDRRVFGCLKATAKHLL